MKPPGHDLHPDARRGSFDAHAARWRSAILRLALAVALVTPSVALLAYLRNLERPPSPRGWDEDASLRFSHYFGLSPEGRFTIVQSWWSRRWIDNAYAWHIHIADPRVINDLATRNGLILGVHEPLGAWPDHDPEPVQWWKPQRPEARGEVYQGTGNTWGKEHHVRVWYDEVSGEAFVAIFFT